MSAQEACSRSKRPAGCPRAVQAASGLTGSPRVSERADEADILPTDRRIDLNKQRLLSARPKTFFRAQYSSGC